MINIFPFCIGMLITYYYVAFVTKGVYSNIIIIGWTIFALFSPILAYFTWMTKETWHIMNITGELSIHKSIEFAFPEFYIGLVISLIMVFIYFVIDKIVKE